MISIHGSGIHVKLPHQPGFAAPTTRQVAELIALDGSIIRQVSALQPSAKKMSYSGPVRESLAWQLRLMAEASASVVIAPGDGHAYAATINELVCPATSATGVRSIEISFTVAVSEAIV